VRGIAEVCWRLLTNDDHTTPLTPQELTIQAQSAYEAEEFQQSARLFGEVAALYQQLEENVLALKLSIINR
jgi:hypothetical protein